MTDIIRHILKKNWWVRRNSSIIGLHLGSLSVAIVSMLVPFTLVIVLPCMTVSGGKVCWHLLFHSATAPDGATSSTLSPRFSYSNEIS